MDKPIISIVVPVYNTEGYMLKQCFDSVSKQTLSNIELIIIDDGSNEETARFLDEYKKENNNVILVHNKNGGPSVARNTGIKLATGEYITFVDADDWVDPDYVEIMVNSFSPEIDIVMCTRLFEFKQSTKENHFFNGDYLFTQENKDDLIEASIISGVAGTWCKVYRKRFIENNDLWYNPNLRRTQDIIFNLYAFQKANFIKYLDVCKYHYRMQNESVTKKFNPKADVILAPAAREFITFQQSFYSNNDRIKNYVYRKCLNILNEIFKLKIMNSSLKISFKERISLVQDVCNETEFSDAISNYHIFEYPSAIGKIRLLLLKNHSFCLLYIMYQFQAFIEHSRNY